MRRLVVGNWKMNGLRSEAAALLADLLPGLAGDGSLAEVAIAPPFTLLGFVGDAIAGDGLALAAQDLHPATHGAFTGEISGPMLADLGVRYVIVGHSERRRLFGETDDIVVRKAIAGRAAGLIPIACVGEDESERLSGATFTVLERQIGALCAGLGPIGGSELVVAYEPVWAIGTGRNASPEQVAEAHRFIQESLRGKAPAGASHVRILYGGSVTAKTAPALLATAGVDGALVGGASLNAESFRAIVQAA